MGIGDELTREEFLQLARAAGLNTSSPHMEELYPIVRATLRGLGSINDLDLAGVEPDMIYIPDGALER